MSEFSEDSRVKYPTIIHLVGIGYEYISSNTCAKPRESHEPYDPLTNILTERFREAYLRLNPNSSDEDVKSKLAAIQTSLDFDDLGKDFYNKHFLNSGVGRIIDLTSEEAFVKNNTFQIATEMRCGDERSDNFRPDITLFVNGLPLAFIEVKKHNNNKGIEAESERMKVRFQNRKFRRFLNITQIMGFSNDMNYADNNTNAIQGAFYAAIGRTTTKYNCFREDGQTSFPKIINYTRPKDDVIDEILSDMNKQAFKGASWFANALEASTPTKELAESLFAFNRFFFLLKYGIAYVNEPTGLQKHIMRYPQVFATKAIEKHLSEGKECGVIWHTQGSGKTALTYFNVKHLTDFYSKQGIIPQFFFIVDRIDLLEQAQSEFTKRGLRVVTVESKEDFKKIVTSDSTTFNAEGEREIIVVNIQKFASDARATSKNDYNLQVKRIYFIDEAHRDYKPDGSFLKNLLQTDRNAIRIALTGTPIVSHDYNTKDIFGEYIHTYYYNASIADGYTLRLIREVIESNFKIRMQELLQQIRVEEHAVKKEDIYAHHNYVEPMLDYVINDLKKFRAKGNDFKNTGGMMVCSSSNQAKVMFQLFLEKYADPSEVTTIYDEDGVSLYTPVSPDTIEATNKPVKPGYWRAALILYDSTSKEEKTKWIDLYKSGKVDLLIVYQMLQTGFDAPRLKKLYLNRPAKEHNLLQTLTRVNRPYKGLKYGNVVDFANIEEEYNKTNARYQRELQEETGGQSDSYDKLFVSIEEATKRLKECEDILKDYNISDPWIFTQQIDMIEDKEAVRKILHALEGVRDLENMLISQGTDTSEMITIKEINNFIKAANHRIDFLNFQQATASKENISEMLNMALENISFSFMKDSESELVLNEQFKESVKHTRQQLQTCFDTDDPEYTNLLAEFQRILKKNNIEQEPEFNMKDRVAGLNDILKRVRLMNERDRILAMDYHNDLKFARVHKRLVEKSEQEERDTSDSKSYGWSKNKTMLNNILLGIKAAADDSFLHNQDLISNPDYFTQLVVSIITNSFRKYEVQSKREARNYIGEIINREYQRECRM